MTKVCIIGGSGHAKVVADIMECMIQDGQQLEIVGFVDDDPLKKVILDYKRIGGLSDIAQIAKNDVSFIIGIGDNKTRKSIAEQLNVKWFTAVHPKAIISAHACIGEGSVLMPGCIINPAAVIGKHVIINSGAAVEHDCKIGDYVHVSPNATLCGNVSVGQCTHIGAGSTTIQNRKIGSNSIIGAGAVVVNDISDNVIVKGVPAK